MGMKTDKLDDAPQPEVTDQLFPDTEEIIVVEEICQDVRMDEQCRLDASDGGRSQGLEFAREVLAQGDLVLGIDHDVTDQVCLEDLAGRTGRG